MDNSMSTNGGIPFNICTDLGSMQNVNARRNIITFMHQILKENRDLKAKNSLLKEENTGNDLLLEDMEEQLKDADEKVEEYKKLVSDIMARSREDQKQMKLLNSRINALKRKINQKEAEIALRKNPKLEPDQKTKSEVNVLTVDDMLK